MALHRDIFWVGKQWAVTGYGMQAVDQKQKSKFDIEASRLWEDDLLDNLSAQRWFNADDFNAGLSFARAKYPEASGKVASRKKAAAKESAPAPIVLSKPTPKGEPKVTSRAELSKPEPKAKATKSQPTSEPAKPAPKVLAAVPASSKLAFTGGPAESTLAVDAKAEPKKPAAAQLTMRIERWPAKFTPMWRVRVNRQ